MFLALGGFVLLTSLLVGPILSGVGAMSGDPEAVRVLGAISGLVRMILLIGSIPYFTAGYGILKRVAWGRILALVVGALSLLSIPFGTALGIYALWALTRPEAQESFV